MNEFMDVVKAIHVLLASLKWEELRSGTTYAGYEDVLEALEKLDEAVAAGAT